MRTVPRRAASRALVAALVACTGDHSSLYAASATTWNLANGRVALPDAFSCGAERLASLELAGSGGSGAVFAARRARSATRVAVKVSWAGSASVGVRHEADIYARLGMNAVASVPRLLAICEYSSLDSPGPESTRILTASSASQSALPSERVVLVLDPFIESAESSFEGLDAITAERAAALLGVAVVGVLAAGVASTDVQVLIDPSDGTLRLIDLSEAIVLESPPSFLQLATARGFCAEAAALVPAEHQSTFIGAAARELVRLGGMKVDAALVNAMTEALNIS